MTRRVRRQRGVALPEGVSYVGRPSRWGNRYVFEARHDRPGRALVASRYEAIFRYEQDLVADPERLAEARATLAGRDLACYCPLDVPCHADVLLRLSATAPNGSAHGADALSDGDAVRAAERPDLATLAGIELAAGELFRSVAMDDVAGDEGPAAVELEAARSAGRLWVATARARPVGYALALVLAAGGAHLEQLSVDPAHGRRGLGRALVEAVLGWAGARDAQALTLSTFADVAWNRPYYERLGFEVLAPSEWTPALVTVREHERSAGLDTDQRVIMRRPLTP